MARLKQVRLVIAAGASDFFPFQGNYVRLKTFAFPEGVEIEVDDGQGAYLDFELVEGEDFLMEDGEFSRVRVTNKSGSETAVVLLVGNGVKVNSAKVSGAVAVSSVAVNVPPRVGISQVQTTVTNVASVIAPLNWNRQYLFIQNKDPVGNIYLNFEVTATIANGILLGPGESFAMGSNIVVGAVSAIGDIASNANVVVLR